MAGVKPLIWSKDARNDLADLYAYLQAHVSEKMADQRAQAIDAAARRLAEWPLIGRPRQDLRPGMRSWAVPPHIIFYRVSDSAVEIVRLIDGRRDIESIFGL
jgi:toxin ParE1/3/4